MYVLGVYILGPFPFSAGEGGRDLGLPLGLLLIRNLTLSGGKSARHSGPSSACGSQTSHRFLPGRMPLSLLSRSPAGNLAGLLRGGRGMLGCMAQMPGHD